MSKKIKMTGNMLNRTEVRRLILDIAKETRPTWECTRVSKDYYLHLEALIFQRIRADVRQHPCGFKTFNPYPLGKG